MHTGAGRVDYHHVWMSVLGDKVIGEDIFHIAGKPFAVGYAVGGCIGSGIFNGLGNIFYTNDFACSCADKLRYCSRAGIKVVNGLGSVKGGEFPCLAVQLEGLRGIGLVERFGAYAEAEVLHLLVDGGTAAEEDTFLIGYTVVSFGIDNVIQRRDLWETVPYILQKRFDGGGGSAKTDDQHNLPVFGGAHEHIAQKSVILPYVIETQPVTQCVFLYGKTNCIRRLPLEIAFFDIQNLVEKFANVEAQSGVGIRGGSLSG